MPKEVVVRTLQEQILQVRRVCQKVIDRDECKVDRGEDADITGSQAAIIVIRLQELADGQPAPPPPPAKRDYSKLTLEELKTLRALLKKTQADEDLEPKRPLLLNS